MKPLNGITRKDGGKNDMIKFDNPDDELENIPKQATGNEESLVVVDNPDDFTDEGED
jgi:hypothetical protein